MSGQLIGRVNVVLEMLECAILLCYILIIKVDYLVSRDGDTEYWYE